MIERKKKNHRQNSNLDPFRSRDQVYQADSATDDSLIRENHEHF